MRKGPSRVPGLMRRLTSFLMLCVALGSLCAGLLASLPAAKAQGLTDIVIDEVKYIAPQLPSDVNPYDPAKPEELEPEQLYAKAAILIEATSGEVIFEKNPDQVMYPASTTKILTVLLGIMMGDMNQEVTMTESAANLPEGSSTIPLKAGETVRFEDLLYATMVRSGNEGSNLIAETIGGSMDGFAELMNQAAAMYGCTDTHFVNPSGLHSENHYSTPSDMAKIARAAMENETFRRIAATYTYTLPRTNLKGSRVLVSSASALLNQDLEDNQYYYPHSIGIKTGYHSHAGYCYVGAAEKDGVELISVVFYTSDKGRWEDTKKLMEYGFSQFASMTPLEIYNQNPITIETSGFSMEDGELGRLKLNIQVKEGTREVNIVGTHVELENISRNLRQTVLISYTRDFSAPITAGELMGTLTYYPSDGGSAVEYDLVASRSIERRLNAPRSIEEIEAEVYADPNPFPPFSMELLLTALAPFAGIFIVIRVLMRVFRRTGRHKKGRVPKPESRQFR